jgi:multicomponent Na+:H+ antiporter subunit F
MSIDTIVTVAQVALGLGAVGALYRLVVGPTLPDRAIALDVILLLFASGVAAQGAREGEESFTPLVVGVALVAFLATATIARYAAWRSEEK